MGSFSERAGQGKSIPPDAVLHLAAGSIRTNIGMELERSENRVKSRMDFKNADLLGFLEEMPRYAAGEGFLDADLDFDVETNRDFDPFGHAPEGRLLRRLLDREDGSASSLSIAEFRFNKKVGEKAMGYSFVKVLYSPVFRVVIVQGRKKVLLPVYQTDDIEQAIVDAYRKPGIVQPLDVISDDQLLVEPFEARPLDVPREIRFLSEYHEGNDGLGDGKL